MTEAPTYTVTWMPELCCERCNSVIHNHFECPECDDYKPGTSIYRPGRQGDEFECQRCERTYELLEDAPTHSRQSVEIQRVYQSISQQVARAIHNREVAGEVHR